MLFYYISLVCLLHGNGSSIMYIAVVIVIQIKSNQIYLTKGPQGHLHCNTSNIQ